MGFFINFSRIPTIRALLHECYEHLNTLPQASFRGTGPLSSPSLVSGENPAHFRVCAKQTSWIGTILLLLSCCHLLAVAASVEGGGKTVTQSRVRTGESVIAGQGGMFLYSG